MKLSLTDHEKKAVFGELSAANQRFTKSYPGESARPQPVHTVYGGAHLFSAGLVEKFGEKALACLGEFAPDADALAKAMTGESGDRALWAKVHTRVVGKLKSSPVEDFRIDYEDGYGNRPDAEEDGHAESVAREVAKAMGGGKLPPFIGIRIKPFSEPCVARSVRTLDLFLSTLLGESKGKLPSGFVVTIPKVTIAEQTRALARLLSGIEAEHGLETGTIKFEIMVEMTQSIFGERGECPLRSFADAGEGRCVGAHFGTYDFTAGCNITATHQTMAHPSCDFAKQMMKMAFSGTDIQLSDGATNVMPVGSAETVHRAWRMSYGHIRHSLVGGFYQGWDLHPSQLPVRYAAVYAFFLEALGVTTERLRLFVEKAARATLLGDVFDDAATGQGLLNFFLRGLSCGAITEEETKASGLTLEEIRSRSFLSILEGRKKR